MTTEVTVGDAVKGPALGPPGPAPWRTPVAWAAATDYVVKAPASAVVYGGETYVCVAAHSSTSDFDATKWAKVAAIAQVPPSILLVSSLIFG